MIRHLFVSAAEDDGNAGHVQGSNWNHDHVITDPDAVKTALDLSEVATSGSASDLTGLATVATSGSASDLSSGTILSARLPAFTGDVTSSAGTSALTVAANAITNAKIALMSAFTVKANLTGSSAIPTDSTMAALTAALAIFTSIARGLVPPSGGGTSNFLRADAAWAPAGSSGGIGQFGNGFMGAAVMDGVNPVVGCSLVGGVYFADGYCSWSNLTITANGSSPRFKPDGWIIDINGTISGVGGTAIIDCSGGDAVGTTRGPASSTGGSQRALPVGGIGAFGSTNGDTSASAPHGFVSGSVTGGVIGNNPGNNGSIGQGGGGGGGPSGAGGNGGTNNLATANTPPGLSWRMPEIGLLSVRFGGVNSSFTLVASGGGGGFGFSDGASGGGCGGWMSIRARTWGGGVAVQAKGGKGGDGATNGSFGNGGGGGGPGGIINLWSGGGTPPTPNVAGGLGGNGGTGASASGGHGGNGGDGLSQVYEPA
jgi:hypothetical protein